MRSEELMTAYMGRNVNLNRFNKYILQYIEPKKVCGGWSIQRKQY